MSRLRKKWRHKNSAQDKVSSFLRGNPSTYEEISKATGKSRDSVRSLIYALRKRGGVRVVNIELSRPGATYAFSSSQLVGELANRAITYLIGEERLLGKKITEYLPKELPPYMRRSLTHRLKPVLPRETFEVVHEYMREHAII